ncbi:unnamed protein product [Strongylus vulgaris]|uniref:Uncharacterized protein n=1 Tax=Strongylus vulgaris TaxID=40348 RepID=A0A3P7KPQ1_STRVU|nr:unnamed protein product [Strongylus vulgaris]
MKDLSSHVPNISKESWENRPSAKGGLRVEVLLGIVRHTLAWTEVVGDFQLSDLITG